MELRLGQNSQKSPPFELNMVTRNASGVPTGIKTFETNSAYELSQFWLRNQGKPKKKKKIDKKTDNTKSMKIVKNVAAVELTERVVK